MSEEYHEFMIFELDDSGERILLEIDENEFREDNGSCILHPEQVCVIVKEDIRRVYIWKGSKSPVRQRFISSRVASQLQEELVKVAAFHRCKIVSVDQGDEPEDFLRAFGFESMEVEEVLADMRYVRNIEKEKDGGAIIDQPSTTIKQESGEKGYYSPALQEIESKTGEKIDPGFKTTNSKPVKAVKAPKKSYSPAPSRSRRNSRGKGLSDDKKEEIIKKIMEKKPPEGFKRLNLIMGHELYGAVSKKVTVFGKEIEETEWEPVKKVPDGMMEIDGKKLRAYFNSDNGMVEALEILEPGESNEQPSSKKSKSQQEKSEIKNEDRGDKEKSKRRGLPKIPSGDE